jgi:hypothetical protein
MQLDHEAVQDFYNKAVGPNAKSSREKSLEHHKLTLQRRQSQTLECARYPIQNTPTIIAFARVLRRSTAAPISTVSLLDTWAAGSDALIVPSVDGDSHGRGPTRQGGGRRLDITAATDDLLHASQCWRWHDRSTAIEHRHNTTHVESGRK